MTIRTFEPGDDAAQVSIYNEAASGLPRFKPATLDEVRRRVRAADFDPQSRFYAVEDGQVVGYAQFQMNGRLNFPWCRPGKEKWAEPLFERTVETMQSRGLTRAWAAYRGDWPGTRDFFLGHGFAQPREMLNFVLDLVEMPTPAARAPSGMASLTPEDIPALKQACPDVFRASNEQIAAALFHNSWFHPRSLFSLRKRGTNALAGVGIHVWNTTFADPHQIDGNMPCFRLGAFGTEGLTLKRVKGLFSFVVTEPRDTSLVGHELLSHAAGLLQETDGATLAAQVASDVPHLVRFYRQNFRPQGSFPVYERAL